MPENNPNLGESPVTVDQPDQLKRKGVYSAHRIVDGSTTGLIHLPLGSVHDWLVFSKDDPHGIRDSVFRLVVEFLKWPDKELRRFTAIQYSFNWTERIRKRLTKSPQRTFEYFYGQGGLRQLRKTIESTITTAAKSDTFTGQSEEVKRGILRYQFKCALTVTSGSDEGKPNGLTSSDDLRQSHRVKDRKSSQTRDWASNLSMTDALRILDEHKAELSDALFPAVSALVLQSKSAAKTVGKQPRPTDAKEIAQVEASTTLDVSNPLTQLKEIANLETTSMKSSLKRINQLLAETTGRKFNSFDEIQDVVAAIQTIVRRGNFDLLLSEKVLNLRAGTKVTVTSQKPVLGYPIGRMVVLPAGEPEKSKRRITLFPLKMLASEAD